MLVHPVLDWHPRGGHPVSPVGHLPIWNVVLLLPLRRRARRVGPVHGGGTPRVLLLRREVVMHGRRRVGGRVHRPLVVLLLLGWPGVVWTGTVTRGGLPVAGGAVVAILPRAPALAVGRRLPQLLLLPGMGGRVVWVWWSMMGWQVVPAAILARGVGLLSVVRRGQFVVFRIVAAVVR